MKFNYDIRLAESFGNWFTLEDFVSRRGYVQNFGWVTLEFSDESAQAIANEFSRVFSERGNICPACASQILKLDRTIGIFRRLYIGKDLRARYCAGQEYDSEVRFIRNRIRRMSK